MVLIFNKTIFNIIFKIIFRDSFSLDLSHHLSKLLCFGSVCPSSKQDFVKSYFCPVHIYVVSPGPTSRKFFVFFSFILYPIFLAILLVKALVFGSGSGIPLNQDIEPSKLRAQLSHATLRFLDWLSSATLKIFISGVSSNSDFDAVKSKFGLLIE